MKKVRRAAYRKRYAKGSMPKNQSGGALRRMNRKKWSIHAVMEAVLLCVFAFAGAWIGSRIPTEFFCTETAGNSIHPITREAGSGTRESFRESFGIERITDTAEVTNSTAVVLAGVMADPGAIGYAALPSVIHSGEGLRVLRIDGTEASYQSVEDGRYPAIRTIFAVTYGCPGEQEEHFLRFVSSAAGVRAIREAGCFPLGAAFPESENNAANAAERAEKLILAGSSSAIPVFTALKGAYEEICEKAGMQVRLEIQQSDSAQAIASLQQGICEIGMTSRRLTEEEKACGLREYPVAADAIVLVVHPKNPVKELSSEEVRKIYEGAITDWSEIEAGKTAGKRE